MHGMDDGERRCSVDGCEGIYLARDYCGLHYRRLRRKHGTAGGGVGVSIQGWRPPQPTLLKLLGKVTIEGECWLYGGVMDGHGYGQIFVGSRRLGTNRLHKAHRASYELFIGAIPKGLDLDHLCRRRSCINPLHLEPVTRSENLRRGFASRRLGMVSA
jgi:hypothetical protein